MPEELATRVAAHLGIFDEVLASDGIVNLVGSRKRNVLETRFGKGGFDYIGDSRRDLAIWQIARQSYVVAPPACCNLCDIGMLPWPAFIHTPGNSSTG